MFGQCGFTAEQSSCPKDFSDASALLFHTMVKVYSHVKHCPSTLSNVNL